MWLSTASTNNLNGLLSTLLESYQFVPSAEAIRARGPVEVTLLVKDKFRKTIAVEKKSIDCLEHVRADGQHGALLAGMLFLERDMLEG